MKVGWNKKKHEAKKQKRHEAKTSKFFGKISKKIIENAESDEDEERIFDISTQNIKYFQELNNKLAEDGVEDYKPQYSGKLTEIGRKSTKMRNKINKDILNGTITNKMLNDAYDLLKGRKRFKKSGTGRTNTNNGGLYDDQIDKIMSKFKDFKGCIMRDEIKKLLPEITPQSRLAFIINTQASDKPGMHWDAVYIDARNSSDSSNSLEWFDSFGRPMPPDILEDCKLILKVLKPETILKVKENHVIHQSDDSSNCGWFCCKFLIDRFRGKSFSDATGFDDKIKINHINKDENEIERLKKVPPFNYIY